MFKWLQRRLLREQIKLIHQNMAAAEGALSGYFSTDSAKSTWLSNVSNRNREIANSVPRGSCVSKADLSELIELNRQLRELYEQTASRHIETFDKMSQHLMGWQLTYDRWLED